MRVKIDLQFQFSSRSMSISVADILQIFPDDLKGGVKIHGTWMGKFIVEDFAMKMQQNPQLHI